MKFKRLVKFFEIRSQISSTTMIAHCLLLKYQTHTNTNVTKQHYVKYKNQLRIFSFLLNGSQSQKIISFHQRKDDLITGQMSLILTETHRDGYYSYGEILFTSETNSVNVSFTSDYNIRWSGFRLNIQSISCQDHKNYLTTNLGCDEQEVQLSTGKVQHGALASETVILDFTQIMLARTGTSSQMRMRYIIKPPLYVFNIVV